MWVRETVTFSRDELWVPADGLVAGDIITDEQMLEIHPQPSSGIYRFRVGAYNWATGKQLPLQLAGKPVVTFVVLDQGLSPRPKSVSEHGFGGNGGLALFNSPLNLAVVGIAARRRVLIGLKDGNKCRQT